MVMEENLKPGINNTLSSEKGFNPEAILPVTVREKEILYHIALGKTNKEISKDLKLSSATVRNHLAKIFIKLKVKNRAEAAVLAVKSGLIKN